MLCPALATAVTVLRTLDHELLAAVKAVPPSRWHAVLPPAVRIEGRGAVRADHPQVLEPVVVPDSVDVVQDQCHAAPPPVLVLTAELADRLDEPGCEQPRLQIASRVARVLNKDAFERSRAGEISIPRAAGVEVIGRDLPDPVHPAPEDAMVASVGIDSEPPKRLGVRVRGGDGFLGVLSGVPWHANVCSHASRSESWGARTRTGISGAKDLGPADWTTPQRAVRTTVAQVATDAAGGRAEPARAASRSSTARQSRAQFSTVP